MIRPRLDDGALRRVPHGGPAGAADEALPAIAIDFSTNVNAWGPAPAVRAAARAADSTAYPDPAALEPRRAAAGLWSLPEGRVRFAAGAVDLIHRTARVFLESGDTALIAAPAFGEYARAVRLAGAEVVEVRADPCAGAPPVHPSVGPRNHQPRVAPGRPPPSAAVHPPIDPPTGALLDAIRSVRPRLVFVASPSSPLGAVRPVPELEAIADVVAPHGLLVLDEAFRSFALGRFAPPAMPGRDDVVHVRSITKDCALAGVRAAFAVAHPDVLTALDGVGVPWSESAPAQRAATAALSAASLVDLERKLERIADDRRALAGALADRGLRIEPSRANYLCFRAPAAAGLRTALRARGLRVRHCASFGLPDHIRIAVRRPAENRRLVDTIAAVMAAASRRRPRRDRGHHEEES